MTDGPHSSPPPPSSGRPPPRRVVTAERMEAIRLPEEPKKAAKELIREGAVETLLNSVGILRDLVSDFRARDSFFKYKAGVLFVWLILSVTSVGVACPGGGPANSIQARLVVSPGAARTAYMIKNDSDSAWENVEVVVNGSFRSTADKVSAGGDLVLSPRLMVNAKGEHATDELPVRDILVRTSDGDAELMRGGKVHE